VIDKYGVLDFESLLRYSWDLGIAVIPLHDPGGFYGACWRIEERNVIVLKQLTDAQARWAIDLGHELKHVASHLTDERPTLIESEEITLMADSGEEGEASDFASDLLLFGRAEELAQECVAQAQGSVERLKIAVQRVAAAHHVPVDALANYMAFRLSLQGINWWGAAHDLQIIDPPPWRIARDVFLERARLDHLGELDRGLLLSALSEPEESLTHA
jgi:Zn-dependent peptidase ImmA (M78 family)